MHTCYESVPHLHRLMDLRKSNLKLQLLIPVIYSKYKSYAYFVIKLLNDDSISKL